MRLGRQSEMHSLFSMHSRGAILFPAFSIWEKVNAGKVMKEKRKSPLFAELGNSPSEITDLQIDILEYYLKRLYSTSNRNINNSLALERVGCFERVADNGLRKVPMSHAALSERTKRAAYQAGLLGKECVDDLILPDPTLWRWKRHEDRLLPRWQCLDPIDIKPIIETCSCKVKQYKTCKCAKGNMPCLPSCNCRRSCTNI